MLGVDGRLVSTRPRISPGDRPSRAELGGASHDYAAAPLWILGEELADALRSVPGPPFEIAYAVQDAIAAGKVVAALEMGPTRDLTRPADVVRHNFPYLSSEGE